MGACGSTSTHTDPPPPKINMASHPHQAPAAGPAQLAGPVSEAVVARGGDLWLGGQKFRFASLCAPELLDGDANGAFEVEDTFRTLGAVGGFARAVTRTYTLRIKSKNIGRGHINGWNAGWGDWEWDGGRLQEMDHVLAKAAELGVRLIIPILNQDYGDESTNWVGNHTDLIRMRTGLATYAEAKQVDWWTDEEMVNGFKLIIDKLLTRTNSVNGRKYAEDPTILAWETGNEMNHLGMRPAPGPWTCTVARHIKHLAPTALVMDGSFARSEHVDACYAPDVLACPDVDILSYHYYGSGDIGRAKKDCELARKHGKVFVAGEFGFFGQASDYARFLKIIDDAGGAGALAWSLRPHSSRGGFKTHGEGNNIWSYHAPGHPSPRHPEFDHQEQAVIAAIRAASYKLNKEKLPSRHPTPPPPGQPFGLGPGRGAVAFAGAAWAAAYDVEVRHGGDGQVVSTLRVDDSTKEGEFGVAVGCGSWSVRARGVGAGEEEGEWGEAGEVQC